MIKNKYVAIESSSLSTKYDRRYVIVNVDTGEIVDDGCGYGYRCPGHAERAFIFKHKLNS